MSVKEDDPDFDEWAVKINGDLMRHDLIVFASVGDRTVGLRRCDSSGAVVEGTETLSGHVRILERNGAVRDKEPKAQMLGADPAPEAPEVAAAAETEPLSRKLGSRMGIKVEDTPREEATED